MKRLLLLLVFASPAAAQDPTYWSEVRPLLRKHCTVCHSAKNLREPDVSGGLALDSPEAIKKGLGSTPVVRPGQADESLMVKVLVATSAKKRMPLDAPPLPKEDIELVRRWISAGAREGTKPTDVAEPTIAKSSAVTRKRDVVFPVSAALPPAAGKGKLEWGLKVGPLAPIAAVAFSPDGKRLAAGSYGQVAVWDLAKGEPVKLLTNVLGAVNDLKFSPDGTLLAVAGGQPSAKGDLRLYKTADWSLVAVLRGHDDVVFSVAFSKDGKQLASASFDHSVHVWDVARKKMLKTFSNHSDFVYAVAFDPSAKYLFTASKDRTVQMIDLTTAKSKFTFTGGELDALAVAVSPDGKTVLTGGYDTQIVWWSTATGEKIKSTGGHGAGGTNEIAFNVKGNWFLSCGADRTARLVDATSGSVVKSFPAGSSVYACAISPDSKLVASGSADGLTRVWDTTSGSLLASLVALPGAKDHPQWAAVTPQGYVAGDDSLLKLGRWRAAGKELTETAALKPVLEQPALVGRALRGETLPEAKFGK